MPISRHSVPARSLPSSLLGRCLLRFRHVLNDRYRSEIGQSQVSCESDLANSQGYDNPDPLNLPYPLRRFTVAVRYFPDKKGALWSLPYLSIVEKHTTD